MLKVDTSRACKLHLTFHTLRRYLNQEAYLCFATFLAKLLVAKQAENSVQVSDHFLPLRLHTCTSIVPSLYKTQAQIKTTTPHLLQQAAAHSICDVLRAVARSLHSARNPAQRVQLDAVPLDNAAAADDFVASLVAVAAKHAVRSCQRLRGQKIR